MATYIIMAFAVALFALLAGFTGGISSPMLSNPRSGSREGENADANAAAEASSGGYSAERKLPSEILDAVAEAERLDARPQVVGQLQRRQSLGFDAQPSTSRPADLGRLVLVGSRRRMLAEIVDGLVDGTQFMTLTGPPGVGKTIMAATIRKELNERSVSVRWVDGGGGSGIRLRTIMSQILGKPETDIDDGDIEQLFDAMTEREELIQRLVLIIDDAERLLPEAIGYLRLLASIAMERMPQIVFVGGPSFWEIARQAAQVGFEDLIAARFELEPLNPLETHAVTQRLLSALSPARKPALDMDALEAVVQRTDGLIGRLVPLVAAIEAIAEETGQTRVTAAVIDAAAARLEGGLDSLASQPAGSTPENGSAEAIGAAGALVPIPIIPHREWGAARMSGAAAALVGSLSLATYWLAPFGIDRISAETRTALADQVARGSVSLDTTIIVRLPASTPITHAGLNASSYDSAITAQLFAALVAPEEVRPPTISVPQIGTSVAAHRSALRKGTVETRPAPSVFVTRASKGTWLFPPNPNG